MQMAFPLIYRFPVKQFKITSFNPKCFIFLDKKNKVTKKQAKKGKNKKGKNSKQNGNADNLGNV